MSSVYAPVPIDEEAPRGEPSDGDDEEVNPKNTDDVIMRIVLTVFPGKEKFYPIKLKKHNAAISRLSSTQALSSILMVIQTLCLILLIAFICVIYFPPVFPFRTKANMSDWDKFQCETVNHEWDMLNVEFYDLHTFSLACRSVYMRSQICEDIKADIPNLLAIKPLEPKTMVNDETIICFPHKYEEPIVGYDQRLPFVHRFSVFTVVQGHFLNGHEKYYMIDGAPFRNIVDPIEEMLYIDSGTATVPAATYKVMFQEHEWQAGVESPWKGYEAWANHASMLWTSIPSIVFMGLMFIQACLSLWCVYLNIPGNSISWIQSATTSCVLLVSILCVIIGSFKLELLLGHLGVYVFVIALAWMHLIVTNRDYALSKSRIARLADKGGL